MIKIVSALAIENFHIAEHTYIMGFVRSHPLRPAKFTKVTAAFRSEPLYRVKMLYQNDNMHHIYFSLTDLIRREFLL